VSPFVEVELVTLRELRRSFRSTKGALLAAISVVGGAGVAMLFAWLDRVQREKLPPGVDLTPIREEFFERMYGPTTGHALASSPYALWMMLIGTLWMGPLLVALMNFDAVSGELQHRTVRFWSVRVRRGSYILGKYLAGWLVVLAVTLGMNVIVWGVAIVVGHLAPANALGWGVHFFAVSLPISAAWCAIATLVGSQCKTPMLSLLVICATFFGLWLLRVTAGFTRNDWLAYAYPNAYDSLLLSPNAADVGLGLLGTGAIVLMTTIAGTLLFQQRDL
jgi:ABC-type transport system involved in multi-copper enzyme maturation permease subunit